MGDIWKKSISRQSMTNVQLSCKDKHVIYIINDNKNNDGDNDDDSDDNNNNDDDNKTTFWALIKFITPSNGINN